LSEHRASGLLLLGCIAAAAAASLALGQDANWDLRNYHYHNPWALLNGRWRIDIAPAQVQTFYNPVGDLPFYFLAQMLPARGVALAMALPTAIAAFFLARIAHLVLPSVWLAAIAVVAGMTGAAGVSVIASTMNEWPSVALIFAGLYLALRGRHIGLGGVPHRVCRGAQARLRPVRRGHRRGDAGGRNGSRAPHAAWRVGVFRAARLGHHGRRVGGVPLPHLRRPGVPVLQRHLQVRGMAADVVPRWAPRSPGA
jgi:hypothetical protein